MLNNTLFFLREGREGNVATGRTHLWHYQYLIVISSDIVYCLKKVKKKKKIQMFFSLPFRFYQL